MKVNKEDVGTVGCGDFGKEVVRSGHDGFSWGHHQEKIHLEVAYLRENLSGMRLESDIGERN